MSKYIKKSFSPHIYQDWIHLFRQCSPEQRSELLLAITDFPNHEPEIEISIWDFIKSQLDTQYQSMENKSQQMSTNRNNKKQKSTEVNQSRPMSTEVDQSSQIEIETGIETRIETEIKEKEISNDISKKKNNQIDYQNDIQIENQIEKPKSNFNENSIIYVNGQYFDEFPPESIPLLKKHWSLEELEDIRKKMAFKPEHQTTVAQMLVEYPPKPKTTRFVKPTVEEIKAYCRERMNFVEPQKFFDYYESNGWKVGKNPMKDWKAAVRTWEKNNFEQPKKEKINFSFYTGEGSFLKPDGEW